MIARVTSIDTGTVTSATSASSGEIQNIIAEHRDDREQRREQLAHRLLQGLADVVDVVGDPAEQLAARLTGRSSQRQPVDLVLDVLAHPADGVLHDAVEDEALEPRQQRGRDVDREHEQQHVADRVEVDALARDDVVHRGEHVGELVLALVAQLLRPPAPGSRPRAGCG